MDVKIDNEAQVCRLCGQFESIYIDVFGDEGSKRLLGLKIQSKINILIDETDPLPKTICVQCLGKLEFVCDFQEECLRTQSLLRNRYDLPPLPNIENDIKLELPSSTQSSPSTSTNNNNNNNNEKSRNLTADIENVDPSIEDTTIVQANNETIRPKRVIKTPTRNKSQIKDSNNNNSSSSNNNNIKNNNNNNSNNNNNISTNETPELTKRWLRSRNTTDTTPKLQKPQQQKTSSKKIKLQTNESTPSTSDTNNVSIVRRLRSSNQQKLNISLNNNTNSNNNNKKINKSPDDKEKRTLQIPTTALNKVITAVSTSTDVKVSVKETKNHKTNNEDISFTLELKKKEKINDTSLTVLAKVFPDQNSALVDSEIIDLLDNNPHINELINTIQTKSTSSPTSTTSTTTTTTSSSCKNTKSNNNKKKNTSSIDDDSIDDLELRLSQITEGIGFDNDDSVSRNPEELYRIDGEEIRVDDNVDIITTNDGPTGYSCKLCKKIYERRDKCTVHVKTHLGIKQYACKLCTAKFVCKSDVMKHIRCSHTNPRPMQCSKCPKRFRSKFDLTEHDNIHKGIKPYRCADCGQSYHHKVSLQMHIKSHLPPQNLACEYCGKVFPFRTRLLSHIGSVHLKNRRNFRCRFCYNLYSSLNVLNDHIKTRHATTFTCDICSKTFKVSSKYKAHLLQHTNPKPYVCKICNNRYASKAFLNEHLLKHEGLRKHVCQKCGASFAQASHLAAHRHVHGEKAHTCPECGRKFNRRDNMKVHRKRHFAESGRIVDNLKNIIDDDDEEEYDDEEYDDDIDIDDDDDVDEASDK